MAITFIEERKRQKKLIWILTVVVLITIIVLWQGFFKKPKEIEVVSPKRVIPEFREVKINFQILETPLLKELQPFEKIKPFEGEIGRENPFLPY